MNLTAILLGPAVIAAMTALLGLLIAAVDMVVNNYGEVKVKINGGKKELTVRGGSPLLLTLSEQGIFIPSACGGRGSCGACKCQINSDVGPHLPTELPYLTKQEVEKNIRLSCQVKVKADIDIEIPEELFYVQKYKCKVASIRAVTHDIKEVVFRLPEGKEISYVPGQYAQIVIPPYGKIKETTQRAYSMSSHPKDKHLIELLVRLVPGGIATTYVHSFLHVGQEVELLGPFGDFHVQPTGATMVCVAGGSGMAPFKSILWDLVEKGDTTRPVWYFFGARGKRDLFYTEEMRELEKKLPNFHYVEALSEPAPDDNYTGETGLITDVLNRFFQTVIPKEQQVKMEGYLCGSPGMINACNKVMNSNGIGQENIYYDSFA